MEYWWDAKVRGSVLFQTFAVLLLALLIYQAEEPLYLATWTHSAFQPSSAFAI